jgi:hypothetical protein
VPSGSDTGSQRAGCIRIEVSVAGRAHLKRPGLVVHRRRALSDADVTTHHAIPVTSPVRTLIDLGTRLGANALEAAINEADKLDRVDPETLRSSLEAAAGTPGVAVLRRVLDVRTFTMTDTQLERRFLPIARKAGLPRRLQLWGYSPTKSRQRRIRVSLPSPVHVRFERTPER